jgi:hypothetical protein
VGDLRQTQGGQRRGLVRLGDDRVAGHERRSELVGQQRRREVPWHDGAHDPQRACEHHAARAGIQVRDGRASNVEGKTGVVAEGLNAAVQLEPRLAEWLALLGRQQRREFVAVDDDGVGDGSEGLATLTRRRRRPPGLRLARRIDRRIDTDGTALHRHVHDRASGRIKNRDLVVDDDLGRPSSDE